MYLQGYFISASLVLVENNFKCLLMRNYGSSVLWNTVHILKKVKYFYSEFVAHSEEENGIGKVGI